MGGTIFEKKVKKIYQNFQKKWSFYRRDCSKNRTPLFWIFAHTGPSRAHIGPKTSDSEALTLAPILNIVVKISIETTDFFLKSTFFQKN